MPDLIVEDGKMPEGANSYATVEQADAYHALRRTEAWPIHTPDQDASDPDPDPDVGGAEPDTEPGDPALEQKQAALAMATDYLNGLAWKGRRAAPGRIMAWPRKDVVDADGYAIADDCVPENVVLACCVLAGLVMDDTDLQPTLDRGGRTSSEGSGITAASYFDDAANRDIFSGVADLLKGLADGFDRFSGTGDNKAGRGSGAVFGKVQVG